MNYSTKEFREAHYYETEHAFARMMKANLSKVFLFCLLIVLSVSVVSATNYDFSIYVNESLLNYSLKGATFTIGGSSNTTDKTGFTTVTLTSDSANYNISMTGYTTQSGTMSTGTTNIYLIPKSIPSGYTATFQNYISDNFDRANNATVGNGWTESESNGKMDITNNALNCTSATSSDVKIYRTASGGGFNYMSFIINKWNHPERDYYGVMLRTGGVAGTTTFYTDYHAASVVRVYTDNVGTFASIGNITSYVPHLIEFYFNKTNGSSANLYIDGVFNRTTYSSANGRVWTTIDTISNQIGASGAHTEIIDNWIFGNITTTLPTAIVTTTLVIPTNNYHTNQYPVSLNFSVSNTMTNSNCTLQIGGANNGTALTNLANGNYGFSRSLADGIYNWTVACNAEGASTNSTPSNQTVYIDTVNPIWTRNANHVIAADNTSWFAKGQRNGGWINLTLYDLYIFAYNVTITRCSNNSVYYTNSTFNSTASTITIANLINWTSWPDGQYCENDYAEDDHTAEVWDPAVVSAKTLTTGKVSFTTPEKNTVTIEDSDKTDSLLPEVTKKTDSYAWTFNYAKAADSKTYTLKSDKTIYYREGLYPFPSFVVDGGTGQRNWVDFNTPDATYDVVAVSPKEYRVTITTKAPVTKEGGVEAITFNSLGGLNIVNLSYNFTISTPNYINGTLKNASLSTITGGTIYAIQKGNVSGFYNTTTTAGGIFALLVNPGNYTVVGYDPSNIGYGGNVSVEVVVP